MVNPSKFGDIDVEDGAWRDVPDWFLGPFWVDDFTWLQPRDYGSNEFHGRFHPAIPYVAMKRFTQPGDTVWDCFAGSGTTLDVGNELNRTVIASDLHPTRNDILKHDASVWHPDVPVDLGIMHPPYMAIVDYNCPMSDVDDVSEFVDRFKPCLDNMNEVLRVGHMLVLVVGEVWVGRQLCPLEYCLDNLISRQYRRIGRIVKDFGEVQGSELTNPKTSNLWKYRLLKFGYFRYGIDTVLFYQRKA